MTKITKTVIAGLSFAALLSACSKSASDAAAAATTFSLSGTMAVSTRALSADAHMSMMDYIKNQAVTALTSFSSRGTGEGNNSSLSNQCSDGSYYRVLCSAWSTPPVSAYGDVNCGSGSSGGFTVAGLPLNTDITCAVRKSSDGDTFKPFATLELPATSLDGTTDNIVAAGNMTIAVSVNSTTGVISATVSEGTNKGADGATTTPSSDPTSLTGFWNLTCPTDLGTDNDVRCRCFLFGNGDKETCVSGGASGITNSNMSININVYKGTVATAFNPGGGTIPAGNIYGGTVWAAVPSSGSYCASAGACASARTGSGEGLPTFSNQIVWDNTAATAALTWSDGASKTFTCGASTVSITVPTVPSSSGTRGDWLTWLTGLVQAYETACATSWTGCSIAQGSRYQNAGCVGNFTWGVLEHTSGLNLPKVRWDWSQMQCNNMGCTSTPAASMIQVEGVDFNGSGVVTHYEPSPSNRYMFDQFIPNSAGTGGSLKNKGEDFRGVPCSGASGACSAAATAASAYLECKTRRELVVKIVPGASKNYFVFNETQAVQYGKYRGGAVDGQDAYSACNTYLNTSSAVPAFMAEATKL